MDAMADSRAGSRTDGVDRCAHRSGPRGDHGVGIDPGPLAKTFPPSNFNRGTMVVMGESENRQQGCRVLLPNPPLQSDEARDVPLGISTNRGAPSLRAVLTISTGPRR
jgi:hypothetical protein